MASIDPKDLTVDVKTRTVRHSSGAEVTFHVGRRVTVRNGDLFPGQEADLLEAAKRAAIAKGMGV